MTDSEPENASPSARVWQAHDGLFQLVLGQPRHAASEIRSVLPPELLAMVDLDRLVRVPGSFVDPDLGRRYTDALFSAPTDRGTAYFHFLIEHQSTPEALMALRMMGYQVRIWEEHARLHPRSKVLPLIIPIVLYQGRDRWRAATDIADLIDIDDRVRAAVGDGVPRCKYYFDDLTVLSEEQLLARPLTPAARMTYVALGTKWQYPDVTVRLAGHVDTLRAMIADPGGLEVLSGIVMYLSEISDTPVKRLREFMHEVGPEAEEVTMTTLAERLRTEGRAEGRTEGRAAMLLDLMAVKFGTLSGDVRVAVEEGSDDQIRLWSTRLISGASTVEDVIA